MDFTDFVDFIAKRLRTLADTNDTDEYLRLTILLRDTCNDTIKKLEVEK